MKFKTLPTVIFTILAVLSISSTAEARKCRTNVGVSVGGCGPCCGPCYQPVYVQPVYMQPMQPVYVQPYATPVYVPPPAYAVPCEPCYPAQPVGYTNFSFGVSWR